MWSRCSPNPILRMAYSVRGSFREAFPALPRRIQKDCSRLLSMYFVKLCYLTLPDHWRRLLSVFSSRHHPLCFSSTTLGCLLSSDWRGHVFVCCHGSSVCCFFSVTNSVGCVVVIIWHSSVLVQQFQWVMKWDCHRAESPSLWYFCDVLPVGTQDCLRNGCSLPCLFQCCLRLVWNLLSHARLFLSRFLTPMFVLLQDSVPMASPAFLLSLFVSIQGLPPISPDPGNAPYTLVSTQPHMQHIL